MVHCSQKRLQTTYSHPLGQSSSFDQFEFGPFRRSQPVRVMPLYLGALRILNIVTRYSNNTLSCSALNREHAGEGFRSNAYIPCYEGVNDNISFFAKIWPDLTRSNFDLGLKFVLGIARSRRGASTGFYREALARSRADRQGVVSTPPPRPFALYVLTG